MATPPWGIRGGLKAIRACEPEEGEGRGVGSWVAAGCTDGARVLVAVGDGATGCVVVGSTVATSNEGDALPEQAARATSRAGARMGKPFRTESGI